MPKNNLYLTTTHTRDNRMNYFTMRTLRSKRYKYIWNLAAGRAFANHITHFHNFEENGGEQLWNCWLQKANNDPEAREKVRLCQHRPEEELYDVQEDPDELNNLADDPGLNKVKERLRSQLEKWMEQQGG